MEKRKYNKDGKSFAQIAINKTKWLLFMAVAAVRNLTRDQALEEAIKDYNDKYKELLG